MFKNLRTAKTLALDAGLCPVGVWIALCDIVENWGSKFSALTFLWNAAVFWYS